MVGTFHNDQLPFAVASIPISVLTDEIEKARDSGLSPKTEGYIDDAVEEAIDKRIVTDSE